MDNSSEYENKITFEEKFQSETLRPIIEKKQDLILQIVKNYNKKKSIKMKELSAGEKNNYINNVLFKETHFTNELKGVIIGNFSSEDYFEYLEMEKDMNKRMVSLLKESLKSNIAIL